MTGKLLSLALVASLLSGSVFAQRTCGWELARNLRIAANPAFADEYNKVTETLNSDALAYIASTKAASKTTAVSPIPVIFHVIVSNSQLAAIGGTAGVARRVDSQIAVLNRDYNRGNRDSTLIPASWKPLYASIGVRFAPAHTDPTGRATLGYEIKINPTGFAQGADGDYGDAKSAATGGCDAWDANKYLNIYCIYFSDRTDLLGITTPPSWATGSWGSLPINRRGICVAYNAWGKRSAASDNYAGGGVNDLGRTLTHEIGHYFEMRHTWGDDMGTCPWSSGSDDGIADTPPESDATFGSPSYTITGGTRYDGCKMNGATLMQPIGIPCLDYMDYTDDGAMYMFTTNQAGAIATKVLIASGESYTLTQHPTLISFPTGTSATDLQAKIQLYPNPTQGSVYITYNPDYGTPATLTLTNLLGEQIEPNITQNELGITELNLVSLPKGIYFTTLTFHNGETTTQQIVLQ
ncbi:MAG: T9SS C-terminal target domain-containing protein [Chitinophagia bacterium]|nr:T9SS C-terminal target domain-containing protein [Chitinophagia bacterium]